MTRLTRVFVALCAMAVLPAVAFAIVPDPTKSTTPECIRVAPSGLFSLNGQVIGTDDQPLGGNDVRLILSGACTDLRLCPDINTPPQFVITTQAAANGTFSFTPNAGGCCATNSAAQIHADPGDVTLTPIYNDVGSTDTSSPSDLEVRLADFVRFEAAFNTVGNSCQDYTINGVEGCDEEVRLADFVLFESDFNTVCP